MKSNIRNVKSQSKCVSSTCLSLLFVSYFWSKYDDPRKKVFGNEKWRTKKRGTVSHQSPSFFRSAVAQLTTSWEPGNGNCHGKERLCQRNTRNIDSKETKQTSKQKRSLNSPKLVNDFFDCWIPRWCSTDHNADSYLVTLEYHNYVNIRM